MSMKLIILVVVSIISIAGSADLNGTEPVRTDNSSTVYPLVYAAEPVRQIDTSILSVLFDCLEDNVPHCKHKMYPEHIQIFAALVASTSSMNKCGHNRLTCDNELVREKLQKIYLD